MHNVTRDIIAAVQGPGFAYSVARILMDDQGNAAVFVPPAGSGPVATFTEQVTQPARGTGVTEDGGQVTWRRKGAGCSFKLAKCQVSTMQLAEYWV